MRLRGSSTAGPTGAATRWGELLERGRPGHCRSGADGRLLPCMAQLPVMAGEFLLLMVFLDKFWFTPVGEVLDKRDAEIRNKLGAVKDNTGDVEKFAMEAAEILKAARQETSKMVNEKKSAKQSELDAVYAAAKAKVTSETDSAIAVLEKESQSMLRQLDAQVRRGRGLRGGGPRVFGPRMVMGSAWSGLRCAITGAVGYSVDG